jgi:phosphoglycolate phosphatase-like HAD superfamily hydrolase
MENLESLIKESRLAIFDFDGTLYRIDVDWSEIYNAFSEVGAKYGHIGRFGSLGEAYGWSKNVYRSRESLIEVQNEIEGLGISGGTRVEKGSDAARWRLSRKKPCSILSLNTSYTVDAVVGHWGFFPTVTIDRVQRPKPDPEGLDLILRTLKCKGGEAVFIGNSDMDLMCAGARGVPFVHVDDIKEEWFE